MSKNIRTQMNKVVGKSLNAYYQRVKPTIDDIKFKEQYQGRIIDCMVGEVDDNYIETPETDKKVVKLEHSKDGVVKIVRIKGKTILVDEEGNETDTPGEGCRLVSVSEDEDNKLIILSKNKNLFDGELENGTYSYDGTSKIPLDGEIRNANFVKIPYFSTQPNVIFSGAEGAIIIWEYDKDKKCIDDCPKMINGIYSLNTNTRYINFRVVSTNLKQQIQIELSNNTQSTKYEPYKQHKTEILLDEPLRSLPNGVCDEIVGNQLIRRVGKMVLNGSENWERMYYPPSENGTHIQFSVQNYFENKNVKKGFWLDKNLFICDIFPRADADLHWSGRSSIGVGGDDTTFMFTLSKNHELYTIIKDVSELKEWLSDNPITVLYELEEPIIEELPNSITLQGFDDATMYIENSITPTVSYGYNALIPYKEELSKQQEEVETNTLDIENNIIPYLMDMEFNLMLMEDNE